MTTWGLDRSVILVRYKDGSKTLHESPNVLTTEGYAAWKWAWDKYCSRDVDYVLHSSGSRLVHSMGPEEAFGKVMYA